MQHGRTVFADAVKHDRVFCLSQHFAHDVDAFGFQPL
jgi:prephenate dehydrogenase